MNSLIYLIIVFLLLAAIVALISTGGVFAIAFAILLIMLLL